MTAAPVTAGLVIDLDAAGQASADGTPVRYWADGSPAHHDADCTYGQPAVYRTGRTGNGGPSMQFTEASFYFFTGGDVFTGTSAEVFFVLRTAGLADPGFYMFGGGDYTYYPFNDGNVYDGSFTATRFSFPAAGLPLASWHVYSVRHDGTTRSTTVDGAVVHTAAVAYANPQNSANTRARLGSIYTDYPWHGEIARVLAYDRVLTDGQRAQVVAHLRATHFDTAPAAVTVAAPPATVGVDAPGLRVSGVPVVVAVPAAQVGVRAGDVAVGTGGAVVVAADSAGAGVDAPPPATVTATVALVSPIGVVVPAARPVFTVTVTADAPGLTVQVQAGTDPDFTQPAAAAGTADAPVGLAGAQVAVTTTTELADGQWWWRARVTGPFGAGDWTVPAVFAVNALEGQAVASGTLTVTAAAYPAPHLWYIDTDETDTDTGGQAVIIGTGFGTAPAVMLGELSCPVVETLDVPAAAPGPAGARVEPGVVCDPWHQQITFTIPDVDPDHAGDALTVLAESGA